MKQFLKNISNQIKSLSNSLDAKSVFVDQPWCMVDEELEIQKLIFRSGGELILSKNGRVTSGTWEYLEPSNTLLIDSVSFPKIRPV